jgi:hypothetical protein
MNCPIHATTKITRQVATAARRGVEPAHENSIATRHDVAPTPSDGDSRK